MLYNIYCDESCHLEHDGINVMVLGAVWCPQPVLKEINTRIKQLKEQAGVSTNIELKWTKVSPAKLQLYKDLVNYFFDNDNLHFRALVIPDKNKLDHHRFSQTHDTWYYKMYFEMLKVIFSPRDNYEIYIDIKDTHSYCKAQELRNVCSNSLYDFSHRVIKKLQPIRSEEVQIMQIVDLLIGATGYANRQFPQDFGKSPAKEAIIQLIRNRSKYTMQKTTLLREDKYNLLIWDARESV